MTDYNLLAEAVRSIATSVVMTDAGPDHKIIYVNPAFETLTGYTFNEVKGKNPRILQGMNSNRSVLRRLRQALESGQHFHGETINYRKDGSEFMMEWQVVPIYMSARLPSYWVATQHDVSYRRNLEYKVLTSADEERRRVARDLHDGVVQELTAVTIMAGNLLRKLPELPENEAARADIIQLIEQVKHSSREARSLAHGMDGHNVTGSNLTQALAALAESVSSDTTRVTFTVETPLFISDTTRAKHIYRIAQEALSNAVRHGRANNILLGLSNNGLAHVLTVKDNGQGLSEDAAVSTGMGINNMRYRAKQLGGALNITTNHPGTVVTLDFIGE